MVSGPSGRKRGFSVKQLDLLLIHPPAQKKIYQSLSADLSAIEPPVWAAMAAEFVRRRGFNVEILDAEALGLDSSETAAEAIRKAPRLVAIAVYGHNPSASTQMMPAVRNTCAEIKKLNPELPILLFGGHAATLSERTLREEPVDFVCAGEGPHTITGLLAAVRNSWKNLDQVPDLWYREDLNLRASNISAPLINPIAQEIPCAAWDLLPMERYRAHNWHCFGELSRTPYAAIYTTLGCPYHCSFCCIQAPFRSGEKTSGYSPQTNSYRFWEPETVLSQIDTLVQKYGVKNIKIADEMFVLNPKHVEMICDGLIQRNYGLNLWAYARVDTVREGMIKKLKRAGFNWLAFGIEAADADVRKDVQKTFSQKFIFETLSKVRTAGISVIANYIFGLPEDTLQTMQATLDLALELNTEFANFYCTMPYPGSGLFEGAMANDSLPKSWAGYSQYAEEAMPMPTRYLSSAEVLSFRDKAFQAYFKNLAYLNMIAEKFGLATSAEIQKMLECNLTRTHAGKA